jgi:hypothetical protein
MSFEYTRQRQGKDFPVSNHLESAEMSVEGNYNNIDGIIGNAPPKDDTEAKTSMLNRLEHFKKVAERNAVAVDGHEPAQEHTAPERGRE